MLFKKKKKKQISKITFQCNLLFSCVQDGEGVIVTELLYARMLLMIVKKVKNNEIRIKGKKRNIFTRHLDIHSI